VTEQIAERWGMLAGQSLLGGKTIKVADGLIAATALHHDLTIVTRNVKDFEYLGVKLLNPWESRSSLQKCAILNAAEVDPHPSFRYRQWLADSLQNY
jgi:hypothetical protein